MSINSTSSTTFTTGVLITDTTNSTGGARGVISNTITPSTALDIQSTLGALTIPRMTGVQRLALTPSNGMIVYDTTDNAMYSYQNGAWGTFAAGADANAKYIVQTATGLLPNAQSLGSLATGILKNTTTTGILSIATPAVDYYSPGNPTTILNDANQNLFMGNTTGNGTLTGFANIGLGHNTLFQLTTGSYNICIGEESGFDLTTGQKNIAIGEDALNIVATTNSNIGIGYQAGSNFSTITNCILIGDSADVTTDGLTNAIAIGAGAQVSANNSMVLGNGVNVGIGTSTPGAKLAVIGGIIGNITSTTTTPYVVLNTDYIILNSKSSTGAAAVTLPTATAGTKGQIFIIKDSGNNAGTNNITITPAAGNIDGGANVKITTNNGFITVTNDGTDWWTVS